MMRIQKSLPVIFFIVVLVAISFGLLLQAKASPRYIQPTPSESVIQYLESRYKKLDIPLNQIQIIQESPLQIEVHIQSLSDGKNWMPTDFENLYLARREAILAFDKGYPIERYTEVLINQNGDSISWARFKLNGEVSYARVSPSTLTDTSTENLVNQEIGKLNKGRTMVVNHEISSSDGFQTIKIHFLTDSLHEANKSLPDLRGSVRPFAENINSHGAKVVIIKFEIKDKKGEVLVNYLYDLQFGIAGWWTADGIDITNWSPMPGPQ